MIQFVDRAFLRTLSSIEPSSSISFYFHSSDFIRRRNKKKKRERGRKRERGVTVSSKRRLILIRRSFGEDQKSLSFSLGTEATVRIRKAAKKKRQLHSVQATLFAREAHRASRWCKQPINMHGALSSQCDRNRLVRFICETISRRTVAVIHPATLSPNFLFHLRGGKRLTPRRIFRASVEQ